MSVKKLLILAAAGVASVGMTAAIAGGPTDMAPPASDQYFYVEGNVGYAQQDFAGTVAMAGAGAAGGAGVLGDGSEGGFVFGADIGYMFNQHFGAELGWTYLPRFVNTGALAAGVPTNYDLRSMSGTWLVLKMLTPITENVDAFFKAGLGYRYGRIVWNNPGVTGSSQIEELRPLLAVGASYNFGPEWMTTLQFMHFVGGTTYVSPQGTAVAAVASVIAPASNVVTLGVGYKFTV